MTELRIPPDDPELMKAFDPHTVQGMLNALTFFARDAGVDVRAVDDIRGRTYIATIGGTDLILRPTHSELTAESVMVFTGIKATIREMSSTLIIYNPDNVGYKNSILKFYARDPSAVLTLESSDDGAVEAELKVTDLRHPDRIHGGTIKYSE
ncbi:MAG: hypothetical protein GWP10_20515 [Nitrospiraceae bacterium]|nr:hypothetical protein [Nitrospiraceae bacterium]